jgi:hypothetical protein
MHVSMGWNRKEASEGKYTATGESMSSLPGNFNGWKWETSSDTTLGLPAEREVSDGRMNRSIDRST